MKRTVLLLAIALVAFPAGAMTQTAADEEAIRQTSLDYIEGWYTGDAERMERALHPKLAKRMAMTNPATGESQLNEMGAEQLVAATRSGYGKQTPESERRMDVTILDVYESVAVVKVVAKDWVDYLQIVEFDDRWVIINVLWELTPEAKAQARNR